MKEWDAVPAWPPGTRSAAPAERATAGGLDPPDRLMPGGS